MNASYSAAANNIVICDATNIVFHMTFITFHTTYKTIGPSQVCIRCKTNAHSWGYFDWPCRFRIL